MSGLFSPSGTDTPRDGRFALVAVERGIDRVGGPGASARVGVPGSEGTLTYRVEPDVQVGDRVEVPLGRGGGASSGIVVQAGGAELLGRLDPERVKPILGRTGARLTPQLVDLARWMAGYYVCPLGMVLATMMPAAVKRATGLKRRLLMDRMPEAPAEVARELRLPPSAIKAWAVIRELPADSFPARPSELAARIGVSSAAPLNRLVKAGFLRTTEHEEIDAFPASWESLDVEGGSRTLPALTPRQKAVVTGIAPTLDRFGVHLLRGVTGSGKTEVYLRILEHTFSRIGADAAALVLVPEISLTPQTAGRFIDRFGGNRGGSGGLGVAVLHSGLTASQRHKQWSIVASGKARLVIGARSAVFAPVPRLGIVIVDEEHAPDYKQDQLPRYHARDVAIKRAQLADCPVILGSATPSMESWANTIPPGSGKAAKYALWELPDRVGGGVLPKVEVVDILTEREQARAAGDAAGGRQRFIGPTLAAALERTLADDGQAILLLNRRGHSTYICCPSSTCGWVMRCDDCEASLVYHRTRSGGGAGSDRGYLRCHHCLAEHKMERQCPLCGRKLIALGAGTQRVEDELVRHFGLVENDTLVRVDGDTMASAADYFDVLSRFARAQIKVLLGTQMIAKGLDYPNVRLVGVIDGDTAISLPDFRAAERTFQLISQVAGRAGRGTLPGRVVVQTVNPTFPAIQLAAAHDYRGFARYELPIRQRSGFPPATRMARIVCRDQDHEKAMHAAKDIAEAVRVAARTSPDRRSDDDLRVEGPVDCPIARIAGFHRVGVEIIARRRGAIQESLAAARAKGFVKSDARTAVDVDPISLL